MNILFDIGGTNIRVAGAEGTELGEVRKMPTPQDLGETIALLSQVAHEIAGDTIECAAGCIPGQIDPEKGVYDANNRKNWEGRHFDTELSEVLGAPVRIANDAAVVGLGENMHGAGRGAARMAYVTVSTGVGAALITKGVITPTPGFHFGHEAVNGEELEHVISGTAVRARYGMDPWELESLDERNKLADILAHGLLKISTEWNPDTIVLGGSMITGKNPIPLDRVCETFAALSTSATVIKKSELGDNGGLYGAAILASEVR